MRREFPKAAGRRSREAWLAVCLVALMSIAILPLPDVGAWKSSAHQAIGKGVGDASYTRFGPPLLGETKLDATEIQMIEAHEVPTADCLPSHPVDLGLEPSSPDEDDSIAVSRLMEIAADDADEIDHWITDSRFVLRSPIHFDESLPLIERIKSAQLRNPIACPDPLASQQIRHLFHGGNPSTRLGTADLMAARYFEQAQQYFASERSALGWYYLAVGSHYVQDMGVAYHAGHNIGNSVVGHLIDGCISLRLEDVEWCTRANHDVWEEWFDGTGGSAALAALDTSLPFDQIPKLDGPRDYVRHLAAESFFLGGEYDDLLQERNSVEGAQALNEFGARRLMASRDYAAGYILHALQQLADLEILKVDAQDGGNHIRLSVTVRNKGPLATPEVPLSVGVETCTHWQPFGIDSLCWSRKTTRLSQHWVQLGAGETMTFDWRIDTEAVPEKLVVALDPPGSSGPAPSIGSTIGRCMDSKFGCALEAAEVLASFDAQAPIRLARPIPPRLPDLAIEVDDIRRDWTSEELQLTIQNKGGSAAGNFHVEVKEVADGGIATVVSIIEVAGIPDGDSHTLTIPYPSAHGAPAVRVDAYDAVEETEDVTNNRAEARQWTVASFDFRGDETVQLDRDLVVRAGATLRMVGSRVTPVGSPTIHVEPGASLELQDVEWGSSEADYRFIVSGRMTIQGGTMAAPESGLVLRGGELSIAGSVIRGAPSARVVSAFGGAIDIEDSHIEGPASIGVALANGAKMSTKHTRFADVELAVEADTAYWTGEADRLTFTTTGIRTTGMASVWLDEATIEDDGTQAGTAVQVEGGHVELTGGSIAAGRAATGSQGTVHMNAVQGTVNELADASGDLELRLTDSDLGSRTSALSGDAFLHIQWTTRLTLRSHAPDNATVAGARLLITDALGTERANTSVNMDGRWNGILPELTRTAGEEQRFSPYTIVTQDNGPPEESVIEVAGPVTANIPVHVLPNLMALDVGVPIDGDTNVLTLEIHNTEAATAVDPRFEIRQDGTVVHQGNLPSVGPYKSLTYNASYQPAGRMNLTLVIDQGGLVQETNESDNDVSRSLWVVRDHHECMDEHPPPAGTIIVDADATLVMRNCTVSFQDLPHAESFVFVGNNSTLTIDESHLAPIRNPFSVHIRGSVQIDSSVIRNGQFVLVEAALETNDTSLENRDGPLMAAGGSNVSLVGTTIDAGGDILPIVIMGGHTRLEDTILHNATGPLVEFHKAHDVDLRRVTFENASTGIRAVESTARLETGSFGTNVSVWIDVTANSHVDAVRTPIDPARILSAAGSSVSQLWAASAQVRSVHGIPVPDAIVEIVDRFGHRIGAWRTDGDGAVTRELPQVVYEGQDEDPRILHPAERMVHSPYTFRAADAERSSDLNGDIAVTLPQTYRTRTTAQTTYHQVLPGGDGDYQIKIRNLGNGPDAISLVAENVTPGWDVSTPDLVNHSLAPGEHVDVNVSLEAPLSYDEPGQATIVAVSEDGNTTSFTVVSAKTGDNERPVGDFSAMPLGGYVGDVISLTSTSVDSDGFIATWIWNVTGTGTTKTYYGSQVDLRLDEKGELNINLRVHDNAGAWAERDLTITVENRAPVLTNGRVSPTLGAPDQDFEFTVEAFDPDDDLPDAVTLILDGQEHEMLRVNSSYAVTLRNLSSNSHEYQFRAVDGSGAATRWPPNPAPGPTVNHPPQLSGIEISPTITNAQEPVRYTVHYFDPDGDWPTSITLQVDGKTVPLALQFDQSARANGRYETTIVHASPGDKILMVNATDGYWSTSTGPIEGPTVAGAGPVGNRGFSPSSGSEGTPIRFAVKADPYEGMEATSADLVLDGISYPMDFSAMHDEFEVVIQEWQGGSHQYHILVHYPTTTFRTPQAGEAKGPHINEPPVVSAAVSPQSVRTGTLVRLDRSATTDRDHDFSDLRFYVDWGDGSAATWSRAPQVVHRYNAPGTYAIDLLVVDPVGGESRQTLTAEVTDGPPDPHILVAPIMGQANPGGTPFRFMAGASRDIEDTWSNLDVQWDFDGDGAPDTDWLPIGNGSVTHFYKSAGYFDAELRVRDTAGHVASTTQKVLVDELRPLHLASPYDGLLRLSNQRQFFELNLTGVHAALDIDIDVTSQTGGLVDLYLQRGGRPDPQRCSSTPECLQKTENGTDVGANICISPAQVGTFYVLVHARSVPRDDTVTYRLEATADAAAAGAALSCRPGPLPDPLDMLDGIP